MKMKDAFCWAATGKELIATIEEQHALPFCKGCQHNPNSEKPYAEMYRMELTPLTLKILEKAEKDYGVKSSCFMCVAIRELVSMPKVEALALLKELKSQENA